MRRITTLAIVGFIGLWAGVPAVRAALLVGLHGGQSIAAPRDLAVQPIRFSATDGIWLHGWLLPARGSRSCIILVPGFKADRMSMLPYARFLHAHGFDVLLYDSRGTGESDGRFTVGVSEVNDVLGAIRFTGSAPGLRGRHMGLLGVSLGAGVALVAAGKNHGVRATVADSAFTDQNAVIERLDRLSFGGMALPLAPIAPFVVNFIGGVTVSNFRPIDVIGRIAPRAILLIHSRHDSNPTTPLSGALRLRRAARAPVALWIAPRGDHAGAFAAQPAQYIRRVVAFFRAYLH